MRDIAFLGFLALMILLAFRKPFFMSLAYIWVDILQPQKISYYLLSSIPLSLIMAILALVFFMAFDEQRRLRFGAIQAWMLALLSWVTLTTFWAALPEPAWIKWDWAWKAIAFGIFLPCVLATRTRIEGLIAFIVASMAAITVGGAIKTLRGGGGYGTISFLQDVNSGLYEGSTLSTVAFATIPLIIYLYRSELLFQRKPLVKLATFGLIFSSCLITIGAEARTGLVAGAALLVLMFLRSAHKVRFAAVSVVIALLSIPYLPASFTERMETIGTFDEDDSASGRVAVWKWTIAYVADHPFGGGFGNYRLNNVEIHVKKRSGEGDNVAETTTTRTSRAKAYHSAYFEVLGEHGYLGLLIFLGMLMTALVQLFKLRRRFRNAPPEQKWVADLADALWMSLITYMTGGLFTGIAFQPPLYWYLALSAATVYLAAQMKQKANEPVSPAPNLLRRHALAR